MNNEQSYEIFNYGKKRDNLLDNLKKIREYAEEMGLTEVAQVIDDNLKIETGFKVAVVGEFKRGKSTLINALLGENVLPSDVIPCTATVNRISYGIKPSVKIVYKEKEGVPQHVESVDFNQLSEYVTKLTETSKTKASDIEEALIEYNVEYLRHGVDIIDTPGLNDASDMTEITVGLMNKAHAAIMVISADAPFSQSEQEFLEDIAERNIGRVLFVVNRIDSIDEEDRERLKKTIEDRIISARDLSASRKFDPNDEKTKVEFENHKKRFGAPKLFALSAKKALKGKLNNNLSLIEESNFNEFETALKKFLTKDSGSVIISSLAFCIKHNAEKVLSQMGIVKNALNSKKEDFDKAYNSSMDTLTELSQKYESEIKQLEKANERAKAYSKGVLDTLEEETIRIVERIIDDEAIDASQISKNNIGKTQQQLGNKIESNVRDHVRSTLKNIEYSIGRELEKEAERLQFFSDEVKASLEQIEVEFRKINQEKTNNQEFAEVAWSTGIGAVAAPIFGGLYTGYKEAGGKGMVVGGVTGAAAAFGVAYIAVAMGITLASPLVLPVVALASLAAALTGKMSARKLFGAEKVETFKKEFKELVIKEMDSVFTASKRKIELDTYNSIDENFKRLKSFVDSEIGSSISQTRNTLEELSTKKARSEAEIAIDLEKLEKIENYILSSRTHAITTIDELRQIEGV